MHYIVDACTVINFHNANITSLILSKCEDEISIGELCLEEVDDDQKASLMPFIDSGRVSVLSADDLDLDAFLEAKTEMILGDGETECIVWAAAADLCICTDDGRARKKAIEVLGYDLVTGSLGILKRLIECELLTIESAFFLYTLMLDSGAFLPSFSKAEDLSEYLTLDKLG